MSALANDCFDTDQSLMRLDEALALIESRVVAVTGRESVALDDALGRILAEPVVAGIDVPPHDNAAVDGYAVYHADLDAEGPTRLAVGGRVAAGHPLGRAARRGEALRIFTGAALPPGDGDAGPDTVVMQEDCEIEDGHVVVPPGMRPGDNRRRAGEDIARGAEALAAGRRLRPDDLGLAASLGRNALVVYLPLRVALFSTGDELREPGCELDPGAIFDVNRHMLRAMLAVLGCAVTDLGILPDDAKRVAGALAAAAPAHDLIITSGGVSVGEEDHVKAVVERLGGLSLWRLAIKPGRPLALGHIDDGGRAVAFVGVPGNPVAVVVTFLRFARPLILRLAGATDTAPRLFRVRAGFAMAKKAGRREFVRCRLQSTGDGPATAIRSGAQGSGVLSSVVAADGLVELPEEMTYLEAGAEVDFLSFAEAC